MTHPATAVDRLGLQEGNPPVSPPPPSPYGPQACAVLQKSPACPANPDATTCRSHATAGSEPRSAIAILVRTDYPTSPARRSATPCGLSIDRAHLATKRQKYCDRPVRRPTHVPIEPLFRARRTTRRSGTEARPVHR